MKHSFADEVTKIALMAVPKVSLMGAGSKSKSGIGMKTPAPPVPSITSGTFVKSKTPSPVKAGSGRNLGTKFSPRTKTVPSPSGGASQSSLR